MQKGIEKPDLAGYSFGAWINARVSCRNASIHRMIMVSPPVGVIDFRPIHRIECLELAVTGSRDEFAPVDKIEKLLPSWNDKAHLEVINGADHFYGGYLEQLESILSTYI
jgi:alpha/beta superfamily hydrolase